MMKIEPLLEARAFLVCPAFQPVGMAEVFFLIRLFRDAYKGGRVSQKEKSLVRKATGGIFLEKMLLGTVVKYAHFI